jgi:hypothetical protein
MQKQTEEICCLKESNRQVLFLKNDQPKKKKNPDLKNEIRKGITLLSYDE